MQQLTHSAIFQPSYFNLPGPHPTTKLETELKINTKIKLPVKFTTILCLKAKSYANEWSSNSAARSTDYAINELHSYCTAQCTPGSHLCICRTTHHW